MADDRPQYQHGVGTIGGQSFHWGSGTPGQYWSVPYGDYPVTPDAPTGAWAHQAGAIPIANNVIPDPLLGRNRIGIMIHSGSADSLDALYTQGCFRVAPQEWPGVRSEILKEAQNGPLYLHVQPGGVASFTNTKTLSQAGDETPAANANAAANTSAGGTTLNSTPFKLPANAPMGMGNNNPLNIKYYQGAEKNYPGLVGPSTNTDQGDPQMKFGSPEAGWNAAYTLLNKKYGGGMTTPNQIIAGKGGWTPGNTQAAANVAKAAGIGPDDDIGFSDPTKAQKFMRALVQQEQGGAASAYPDAMIAGAIAGKPAAPGQPARPVTPTPASAYPPGTTINSNPVVAAIASGQLGDAFKKLNKTLGGKPDDGQDGQQQQQPSQVNFPQPQAQNVSTLLRNPQLYAQRMAALNQPVAWGAAPPGQMMGTGYGPQNQPVYGTSLMSQLQMLNDPMWMNQTAGAGYG